MQRPAATPNRARRGGRRGRTVDPFEGRSAPRRCLASLLTLLCLTGCLARITREDVVSGNPLAGLPWHLENEAQIRAWFKTVANRRSSSLDLAGAYPYVETTLSPESSYERVGFFFERDPWRVAAVLLWLKLPDPLPASTGTSPLMLWGVPLEATANPGEFSGVGAHAVLRVIDLGWKPPARPQIDVPTEVPIKTPTRAVYKDQLFALVEGRIWFKRRPSVKGTVDEPWRLFGDGLPDAPADGASFARPRRIESLSADGNNLLAIDDTGRAYLCTTATQDSISSVDGWNDGWGFPGKRPLHMDGRAANARAWSIGRRAEDARWYEDAIGNRHHFGPMGTTTLYVLHENGQELLTTDDGLPNDFSRELCGPDDGRFIADNLSASASAIMLIDRWGRVMTQFNDYDLNGGTPNFEYTYRAEVRPDEDGANVLTSVAPYYLPVAPWQWQPSVALTGQARISRQITVLQTGAGNAARELRIAGRGPAGEAGYYYKPIESEEWSFEPSEAARVDDALLLDADAVRRGAEDRAASGAEPARSTLPRGRSYRTQWKGTLEGVPGVEVELDWNPYCSPGRLTFHLPAGHLEAALHTVDLWTPAQRQRPGFDGTPLLLEGTLVMEDAVLTDRRPAARSVVDRIRPWHQRTFGLLVTMQQNRVTIRPMGGDFSRRHPLEMALERVGAFDPPDPVFVGRDAPHDSVEWLASTGPRELSEAPALSVNLATAGRDELERALAANRALAQTLRIALAARSTPKRELGTLLESIQFARPFVSVVPLGRVPILPSMLSMLRQNTEQVLAPAEANVEAVTAELARRIEALTGVLEAKGASGQPVAPGPR